MGAGAGTRGGGRVVPLLVEGVFGGAEMGIEERRLGSTWQGLSVTFMSKEQARPQQVPFLRG